MTREFPNVTLETTRHGRRAVYFRLGKGQRIRLPDDIGSEAFTVAYLDATDMFLADVPDPSPTVEEKRRARVDRVLRGAIRSARTRAGQKRLSFDIDAGFVQQMARDQDYRCALSGIPFFKQIPIRSRVDPFTPSIDRIEPSLGYVKGNVRLVLYAVNAMLLDWGELLFARIAHSYLHQKRTKATRGLPEPNGGSPSP